MIEHLTDFSFLRSKTQVVDEQFWLWNDVGLDFLEIKRSETSERSADYLVDMAEATRWKILIHFHVSEQSLIVKQQWSELIIFHITHCL